MLIILAFVIVFVACQMEIYSTEPSEEAVADNLVWLTIAERTWPEGAVTKRGQVLISPAGMKRLKEHVEEKKLTP